jgi:hypothetical protein
MEKFEGIIDECAISSYTNENHIVFDPLQAIQRYQGKFNKKIIRIVQLDLLNFLLAVIRCLDHPRFKKRIKRIVEFGVNEMKFFIRIKNSLTDRDLVVHQVDIDGFTLEGSLNHNAKPCLGEYVKRREYPLNVHVWEGSITDPNPNFIDIDAVVAIELIEHVYEDVLAAIPNAIFNVIQPKIAIVTTPNGEFNKLFNMKPGDFRHPDHKFEFTREEFKAYCEKIIESYPNYHLQIEGIGPPPKEVEEDVGCCSQLGLFVRKDFYESLSNDEEIKMKDTIEEEILPSENHKLIASISYPHYKDARTNAEKILDEAKYHVSRFKFSGDEYLNEDKNRYEIPLSTILPCCWEITQNKDEIEQAIKQFYIIEDDCIILNDEEEDNYENDENFN